MSARGSGFLLPAWASALEARGRQEPGSPYSVPGELGGGLGVLLLPTAPCDCARAARPGRASHTRATAAALRVRRGLPPLLATPRPQARGPSSASVCGGNRGEVLGPPPHPDPCAGSGHSVSLGSRGRGAPRVMQALVAGCAVAHPVLGCLFIAGGTARRLLGLSGSQQVALPARSPGSQRRLASSAPSSSPSETDVVETAHNMGGGGRGRPSHLALPRLTPSPCPWRMARGELRHGCPMGRWHARQENQGLWETTKAKCPPGIKHQETPFLTNCGSDAEPGLGAFSCPASPAHAQEHTPHAHAHPSVHAPIRSGDIPSGVVECKERRGGDVKSGTELAP